ncbi:molybdate ABC transporter substrate-binding protein [Neobacillus sp. OS1-2]|uniref:molybdate ABC transporter substrate-binding protein n=1 Tax=Neobacillus sp. OS1-2 TaxID=3070680 RepID=UPI0027E00834|nr:molybdate ABC transporter substrate-binding protein [Neobacillus sp. OS1-2]WML41698.1 molybdate ABC transporter substrate-binding protein [Neobacillus sp. OS1-2]
MKKTYLFFLTVILLVFTGCSAEQDDPLQSAPEKDVELTISAAASLQDALHEITANFNQDHDSIKINYNFGATGALQQQISQGAPVDLFFSAAEDKFDQLVTDGLIVEKNGTDLIRNELVLIAPKESAKGIQAFEDLTKADKLSIGTPESVPAGAYGKEVLEKLKLWSAIEGKIVYAKDVRQVLTYVETGNVDAGIVYKTDALTSDKVVIVSTAAEDTHTPIVYPVGIVKASSHLKEAMLFYEYLQTKEAMKVFEKYGFKGM